MKNVAPPKPIPAVKPWRPSKASRPAAPEEPVHQQGGRWKAKEMNDRDKALLAAMERLVVTQIDSRRLLKRQLEEEQAKGDFVVLAVIWAVILVAVVYMGLMSALAAVAGSPAGRFFGIRGGDAQQEMVVGGYAQDDRPLALGSTVGTWKVTSPRGVRVHPVSGQPKHHGGADLVNTAGQTEGHPLVMPWRGEVECFTQSGGAGNGAILRGGPGGLELRAFHMRSACKSDRYRAGQPFGEVGNTGTSTGAHLHLERYLGGAQQEPTMGDAMSILGLAKGVVAGDGMQRAIALIKEFEGFHPTPYSDYKQCSWGYGTAAGGHPSNCPQITISREQAEQELMAYLERNCVPLLQPLGLNANQFAALASKCYNLGPGQFRGSRTYQAISGGDSQAAAAGFDDPKWMNAGGKQLPGLVSRRAKEKAVFLAN